MARHSLHTGGSDSYLVLDNLGSVVAVVNTAGTVAARYSYDPYGNAVSVDESGLSQPNIVRYTGGALDQTTGLTKLGQRYYDPALGRFTQQDSAALLACPQDGNLYAYTADNPANYVDPTGTQFEFPPCGPWNDGEELMGPDGLIYVCQQIYDDIWDWLPIPPDEVEPPIEPSVGGLWPTPSTSFAPSPGTGFAPSPSTGFFSVLLGALGVLAFG